MSTVKNTPQVIDVLLVSNDTRLIARTQTMASEFNYTFQATKNIDEMSEKFEGVQVHFLVVSTEEAANKDEAVGVVQVAKHTSPDSFVMVVLSGKMDSSSMAWIRKSGADVVLFEHEYFDTSKLEFFAFQSVRSEYQPVKAGDFIEGSSLDFVVYHFLPQNRKYLPVVHKKTKLEEKRIKKMFEVGDVYIKRSDIPAYFKYLNSNEDSSAKGLVRRCRAQFLTLSHSYIELLISLTEQTDTPSFDEGKKLLQNCLEMSANLLNSLMTVGRIQDIIGSPQEGDFGSIERAVDRAAMAGFFSMLGNLGKPEDVMLAALLMDIGIIGCSPIVQKKIRLNLYDAFTPEELADFQNHPQRSLNYALSRKLQLSIQTKEAVLYHHCLANGKGFPQIPSEKLGIEPQLLRFCQLLDEQMTVSMGRAKPQFREIFGAMLKAAGDFSEFSPTLVAGLRSVLKDL
jgi:response regulator RpfG family c-di-GMP phosphodiesterase